MYILHSIHKIVVKQNVVKNDDIPIYHRMIDASDIPAIHHKTNIETAFQYVKDRIDYILGKLI